MASYYKTVKGAAYDRKIFELAEAAVKGKDGVISIKEAKRIIEAAMDSAAYTDIEKRTIEYIRDHFDFTPDSKKAFVAGIKQLEKMTKGPLPAEKPQLKSRAHEEKSKPAKPAAGKKALEKKPVVAEKKSVPEKKTTADSGPSFIKMIVIIVVLAVIALIGIFFPTIKRFFVKQEITQPAESIAERKSIVDANGPRLPRDAMVITDEKTGKAKDAPGTRYYEVKRRDSLFKISKSVYGKPGKWKIIFEANRDQIKEEGKIIPGQKLKIPPLAEKE